MRHDRLTGAHVDRPRLVLDAQHAAEHDRDLFKRRPLSRFQPALRRDHARDAHAFMSGVDASCVFFDALWLVAGRGDDRGVRDQRWHRNGSNDTGSHATAPTYSSYVPAKSWRVPGSKCHTRVPTSSIRSWSCVTRNTVPSNFCNATFN